jgi:hypothetical protein
MADRRFYELVVYVPGFDYVARIQTNLFVELPANPDKYSIGQALLGWGALTPDSNLSDVDIYVSDDGFLIQEASSGSLVYELQPPHRQSKKALTQRKTSYKKSYLKRRTSRPRPPAVEAQPVEQPPEKPEVDIEEAIRRRLAAEIAEARIKKSSRRR